MPPKKPQTPHSVVDKSSYIRERIEAAKQRKQDAAELAELWSLNFSECPVERQYTIWLRRYVKNVVVDGIERTAEWHDNEAQKAEAAGQRFSKPLAEITAYATGVMIRMTSGEVTLNGRKYTRIEQTTEEPEDKFLVDGNPTSFLHDDDDDDGLT